MEAVDLILYILLAVVAVVVYQDLRNRPKKPPGDNRHSTDDGTQRDSERPG